MKYLTAILLLLSASLRLHAQSAGFDGRPPNDWQTRFSNRLERDIAGLRSDPTLTPVGDLAREEPGEPAMPRTPFVANLPVGRGSPWLPLITSIFREQGLPTELVGVAAVESGFNPSAVSLKGARGIWQLMPETARRFGLEVNTSRDDRTNPLKSTLAAAQYLKSLYAQFGDWPLALAAYNAGESRVHKSLHDYGTRDFRTLSRALPQETRRYIPAVLANVRNILKDPHSVLFGKPPSLDTADFLQPIGKISEPKVVFAQTSAK
jgi:hypothetical protein